MNANTLFLRFEGPLQAWGNHESKFVVRRTGEAPSKSGIIGMLCCAMGISRPDARERLPRLNELRLGVRIDEPGVRWWDYHTVGAGMRMRIAEGEGKHKQGALLTRREYLCDASFLAAVQGDPALISELREAMSAPKWTLYLGRKSCIPSRPLVEGGPGDHPDLLSALKSVPWRRRLEGDPVPRVVDCLFDWLPSPEQPEAPEDALIHFDVPVSFDPPAHRPRFVLRRELTVGAGSDIAVAESPVKKKMPAPERPHADYKNTEYRIAREKRLEADECLCVFCKAPATTVQHVTYVRAGGGEHQDDLRSLCRLCHDAVTMIEYGRGMGVERINPEDPYWRDEIIRKRDEIIQFRSLETRRRKLSAGEEE